jgi:hypothetical protein
VCILASDLPVLGVDGWLAPALGRSGSHLQRADNEIPDTQQLISEHQLCLVWMAGLPPRLVSAGVICSAEGVYEVHSR